MTPEEFTASRRQNVKLPNGMEFEIHRLGGLDLLAMGGSPDLSPLIGKPKQEVMKAVAGHVRNLFKNLLADLMQDRTFLEKVVLAGVIAPKIVRETHAAGTVCIGDLLQDELSLLAVGILNFSFLTKQEAEKVGPLSETENSCSISTPSEGATESSQAKLSESPKSGSPQPTPSMSHVQTPESPKKTPPASEQSGRAEGDNPQ